MDARKHRKIAEAKRIFQQQPEQNEPRQFPNIFGIEGVTPTQRNVPMTSLPHLQAPVEPEDEPEPEAEPELEFEAEPEPEAEAVPQNAYQQAEQQALKNPNDLAAQEQYNSMTAQKLSGYGKPKHNTEVFLRTTEREKIVRRSMELASRRKVSTNSERPSFFE